MCNNISPVIIRDNIKIFYFVCFMPSVATNIFVHLSPTNYIATRRKNVPTRAWDR